MHAREEIRFVLNETDVAAGELRATDTLLDFLRLRRGLTGTKEGCAEGDCGACTVLVGELRDGSLRYAPVTACIRLLASLDGCHVVTVEHLSAPDGPLHPVQQAMVDHHGSQCGFCTPGIVMALAALWMETPAPTDRQVETALQGNLCRCTGYAPILRAARAAGDHGTPQDDPLVRGRAAMATRLAALRDGARVTAGPPEAPAIVPADADDLARVLEDHPRATLVAGGTDVGLWVTKELREIAPAVFVGGLDDLRRIETDADGITLGAGVSYADALGPLAGVFPHLDAYLHRIGGAQIRAMGTVGGNIANGSPIGDMPPALIALGATLTLRQGDSRRTMPLESFFIDYGTQDRRPGEFVEAIHVPCPAPAQRDAACKISKRRDEDISALAAGISVTMGGDDMIGAARLAFGGMAATPRRAPRAEAALTGRPLTPATAHAAAAALAGDFAPITDWRATAHYRMRAAQNLLHRFVLEQNGETARLAHA
ncbi:xanthine dehydrogenase small subunit [Roseovarius salinarum]|uniref:xanthine dehydrogenase small subunit n=1 Tax=Roseovarius salinarum TaxID=1981892 RepID=UPI000C325DC8|nr:xanthine dehydrogenase small subunit [Roseovarius salinarum]